MQVDRAGGAGPQLGVACDLVDFVVDIALRFYLTCGRSVDRRSTSIFQTFISHFLAISCFVFCATDIMRPVTTKSKKMRSWQRRAEVLGHVERVDCEEQNWSDTIDGKWHPDWEEPEEGAKDHISDISYIATSEYLMPELGERAEELQLSDAWTQTMPDGDHAVQVEYLIEEINCRKMAFDHMCGALRKQKVVIDSDMHVMLTALSAMNKRIKSVFDQVDAGEEYNEAIERQFSMEVYL